MKTPPSDTVAVVIRDDPSEEWVLQTWASRLDVGINCAKFTAMQEGWCGRREFETKVLSEKDYDAKRLRVQGLAHFRASQFPERSNEPIQIRVATPAPRPLPMTRPAPKPLALPARPRMMIKVKP